jgi:hypothetical protein
MSGALWNGLHTYRVEWETPASDPSGHGYLRWFFDNKLIYGVSGSVLARKGNAKVRSYRVLTPQQPRSRNGFTSPLFLQH